jgi:hypothetical protein
MRKLLLPFITVLALAVFGCAGPNQITYNTGLDSVERPSDTKERYGEYTVTSQDTTDGSKYIYEDELIRASWLYSAGSMLVTLQNKSDHSIQARLEQGAFVMPDGSSERILLGDMSYADRNQEVQPITIPSGASTSSVFIPEGNVGFSEYSGVTVDDFFSPTRLVRTDPDSPEDVEDNIGETFSLLLPLEIQGTINEYTFTFEVIGAKIGEGAAVEPQVFGEYPSEN